MPFALDLTLGDLVEGANAAEPDVVDPSSSLALATAASRASRVGFHCRLCAGHMHNALHGLKAWRGPGKRDRSRRRVAGCRVMKARIFCLSRRVAGGIFGSCHCPARGNKADFQCLRRLAAQSMPRALGSNRAIRITSWSPSILLQPLAPDDVGGCYAGAALSLHNADLDESEGRTAKRSRAYPNLSGAGTIDSETTEIRSLR